MGKLSNNIIVRAIINVLLIVLLMLALLMNISLFSKCQALAVVSGSMEPTLPYGSLIIISPQEEYTAKDIVTFRSTGEEEKRFTHRILSIENGTAITKGDANNTADPEPTALSRAEGKVVFQIPFAGFLVMWFGNQWVKLAAVALVILWLAVELEVLRKGRKNAEEESIEGKRDDGAEV